MTKYHAHQAIVATGFPDDPAALPSAEEFAATQPAELRPLILGPIHGPGGVDGAVATYVFLPDGEDSWHNPTLGGDEAREAFLVWLAQHAPDFDVVRVTYGQKRGSADWTAPWVDEPEPLG